MSKELDNKLREIILSPFKIDNDGTRMVDNKDETPIVVKQIAQIHQAFESEYPDFFKQYDTTTTLKIKPPKLMTGAEWLSRFEKELDSGLSLPEVMDIWVRTSARRASGVE